MILTTARTPSEYVECLAGWQRDYVVALRAAVLEAAPELEERLKWGHLVYFSHGPVLLIRSEPTRVLFGFWRGKRLQHMDRRLKGGGKYEMATLELKTDTPLDRDAAIRMVGEAVRLNAALGDATAAA
jgi:hypothetical protein